MFQELCLNMYILSHHFNTNVSITVIINYKNTWKRHLWFCIIVPNDLPSLGHFLPDITLIDDEPC